MKDMIGATKVFILLFSLLLSLGQGKSFAQQQAESFEEIKTETIDGVIVPEHRARDFYFGNKVKGYFTPPREDILRAEAKVIDYIEDNTPQARGYPFAPDLDKKLANYKRQYVGIVLDAKRKIWFNFFCNAGNDSWKRNPYSVIGGGACYFNLLYDVDSETFSDLWINGLAILPKSDTKLPDNMANRDGNLHNK